MLRDTGPESLISSKSPVGREDNCEMLYGTQRLPEQICLYLVVGKKHKVGT